MSGVVSLRGFSTNRWESSNNDRSMPHFIWQWCPKMKNITLNAKKWTRQMKNILAETWNWGHMLLLGTSWTRNICDKCENDEITIEIYCRSTEKSQLDVLRMLDTLSGASHMTSKWVLIILLGNYDWKTLSLLSWTRIQLKLHEWFGKCMGPPIPIVFMDISNCILLDNFGLCYILCWAILGHCNSWILNRKTHLAINYSHDGTPIDATTFDLQLMSMRWNTMNGYRIYDCS